jgi:hypothetical protein
MYLGLRTWQHDTPDRLRIPERMDRRDREIGTLLTASDRVRQIRNRE